MERNTTFQLVLVVLVGSNPFASFYLVIFSFITLSVLNLDPAGNCMFKVNNRNTKTRGEICSKLTMKTLLSLSLTLNIFHTLF